jgi:hypothetical protein
LEETVAHGADDLLDEVALREQRNICNRQRGRFSVRRKRRVSLLHAAGSTLRSQKTPEGGIRGSRQRAQEQERLHKAESERVKLLLEKRKRERIFGLTVLLLGITILAVIAVLGSWLVYALNQKQELWKEKAADLETSVRH